MPDNPIKYSDLVQDDDSIVNAISQLTKLNIVFMELYKSVTEKAISIRVSLEGVSGATKQMRDIIHNAAIETEGLAETQKELTSNISKTNVEIITLKKAETELVKVREKAVISVQKLNEETERLTKAIDPKSYIEAKNGFVLYSEAINQASSKLSQIASIQEEYGNALKDGRISQQNYYKQMAILDKESKKSEKSYKELVKTQQDALDVMNSTDIIRNAKTAYNETSEAVKGYVANLVELRIEQASIKNAVKNLDIEYKEGKISLEKYIEQKTQLQVYEKENANAIKNTSDKIKQNNAILDNSVGSYNRLAAQYKLLKEEINSMNAAETRNGKTKKELQKEAKELYKEMDRLQQATGKHQLNVGNYGNALKGVTGVLGKLGIAVGAVALAKQAFMRTVESSGSKLLNFQMFLSGAKTGVDYFFNALATGDWTNFMEGIKDAIQAGKEYIDVMKELERRALSIGIKEEEINKQIAQQNIIMRDRTKTKDERIAAAESIIVLEKEILSLKRDEIKKQLDVTMNLYTKQFKISKETAEIFLTTYHTREKEIEAIKEIRKIQKEINNLEYLDSESGSNTFEKDIKTLTEKAAEIRKEFASIELNDNLSVTFDEFTTMYDRYEEVYNKKKGGEALTKLADLLKSEIKAEREMLESTTRAETMKSGLEVSLDDETKAKAQKLIDDAQRRADAELQIMRQSMDAKNKLIEDEYQRRETEIRESYKRQNEDLEKRLEREKDLLTQAAQEEIRIIINTNNELLKMDLTKLEKDRLNEQAENRRQHYAKMLDLQLTGVAEGSQQEHDIRINMLKWQHEEELRLNSEIKDETLRQDVAAINAKYDKLEQAEIARFNQHKQQIALKTLQINQDLTNSEIDLIQTSERKKTKLRLELEKKRLEELLRIYKENGEELTEAELQTFQNMIAKLEKEIKKAGRQINIYDILGSGLDSEQQQALNNAYGTALNYLNEYMAKVTEAANIAVNNANKRVDAAKNALDAELQANRDGYASNVSRAAQELALAEKTQQKAIAEQEKAQKQQARIESAQQASSLITATANLLKGFSSLPIIGMALAIAAIAAMWGTFAASKIKARQVAKQQSESYGEGTVEMLDYGGSHASGNDIDLGLTRTGKRRKAEKGEYFAVINRQSSRKYKGLFPDVIKSFNQGNFEERFLRNFNGSDYRIYNENKTDLRNVERKLDELNRKYDNQEYYLPDGRKVIKKGNYTRIIRVA